MDNLIWACKSLHLFALTVWCGGLLYEAGVTFPLAKAGGNDESEQTLQLLRRFVPFTWMSVWTLLVTGLLMMLFSPQFRFLEYKDAWSIRLGLKHLTFLLMVFFSFGYTRMIARAGHSPVLDEAAAAEKGLAMRRLRQFHRINVVLAIAAILLGASLI